MSYEAWVEPDVDDVRAGYTANVAHMWERALRGVPLRRFDGAPCVEAAGPLAAAARRMEAAGAYAYRDLEPDNGWGDYLGALGFLGAIAFLARTAPPGATLRVST